MAVFKTCLVALLLMSSCQAFEFSCPFAGTSDQPPIVNGSAYAVHSDISIEGKNTTLESYEVFNEDNGTIFLYVKFPDAANSSIWLSEKIIHDYVFNQTFVINLETDSCEVSDLVHNETYSIFGMGIENGFKNPEYAFRWRGDYNYTKSNVTTIVNGILAEKYNTCLTFNNGQIKYEVDLLFSTDDWNSMAGSNVPLALVLKVNWTEDGGKVFNEEKYTYTFTSYRKDNNLGWKTDMPHDIICPGRKDTVAYPLQNATQYGYSQQLINKYDQTLNHARIFYDYDEKLHRYDFHPTQHNITGHTIIHDFHSGVEYFIDRVIGSCSVRPINNDSFWDAYDVELDPANPGHFHMINMIDAMKAENYTYTGRHVNHHGMPIDSFTSGLIKMTGKQGPYDMRVISYYTTSDWTNGLVSPVPIGFLWKSNQTVNGTFHQEEYDLRIFDVVLKKHPYTFEIGECFSGNLKKTYVLKFAKQFSMYLTSYSALFDDAVRSAVAKAAQISMIRVASHVEKEEGNDAASDNVDAKKSLFVSVTLYDKPRITGNTSELTPQINMTTAVSNLQAVVQNNMLTVKFQTNKSLVSMVAFPDYFKERPSLYAPPSEQPKPDAGKSLSTGALAALSIGMAVLGFIVGSVVCHFRYKRGNRQFGYGIQD